MELKIYSGGGTLKLSVEPKDSSTQVEEIQTGNVLNISFTLPRRVSFEVNDYVDFLWRRYWLTEKYRPVQKSTMEWEYSMKFYGLENLISRFLVLNTTDGDNEPVFSLTAPPREHVGLIVKSINAGFGTNDWKVGTVDGGDNIVVDYHGKYCDAGLKAVADAVGSEFWIEGTTVNLCRCEHGERVTLGYQNGLTKIQPDVADNAKVYTRLFPTGSSKNIDPAKYGHSRLQLPGGVQYVDVNTDKYGIIHHYEENAFADIFPRYTGTVSNVRSEERTNEEGDKYSVYYFKDDNLPFDPNNYDLGSLVKRVTFQEGSELAGLGNDDNGTHYFEINFDSGSREFEIVPILTDSGYLPGGVLVPKPGDRYIPWNMLMPDEYYPIAEAEFLAAVHEYNRRHCVDVSCFKAPTDYIEIEKRKLELHVGQRVRLESPDYFPETGYKDSRITKITRKVNLPSQMDIEIGDALSRSTKTKINDSIADIRSYATSIKNSISIPDIIRTGDNTKPTDNNLFSARRTLSEFVSRKNDDIVAGLLKFLKGLAIGDYQAGVSGGFFGKDADGDSFAEVARLYVRVKAFFETLTVINAEVLAGKQYITPGGGVRCIKVEETDSSYRCYFLSEQDGEKTETKIIVGDQAIAEMFNAKTGTANKVSNHRYWRLVTAVDNDAYTDDNGNHYGYIELSKTDCETGSDMPQAGDEICQLGNRNDHTRQTAMVFSTVDADAPSIKLFSGINHYSLEGKAVVSFGQDPTTGKVYFRLGASGAKHYLEYTQDGGLVVAGKISSKSTYVDSDGGESTFEEKFDATIADTDVLYISHTSPTVLPEMPIVDVNGAIIDAKGWQTQSPEWQADRYIWQTTYTLKGDGTAYFSDPTCIQGAKGNDGSSYAPNLLLKSNVQIVGNGSHFLGEFVYENPIVPGKEYTLTMCYELDDTAPENYIIASPHSYNTYQPISFNLHGGIQVESKKFVLTDHTPLDKMRFYINPAIASGAYPTGIKIHWAVLQSGDTGGSSDWVPASSEMVGKSSYFHIKYSPVSNPTASQMTETPDVYIGTYVDYTEADSNDPSKYTWARFQGLQGKDGSQGIPGKDGESGKTTYLHIKYSNDGGKTLTPATGGLAIGETPGDWIGQYTDFTQQDSTDVTKYTWSRIKGDQGNQGIPGPKGDDGTQYWTWIKYSDNSDGTGMYDTPNANTKYIGIAVNKTTQTESSNKADYTWSQFRGDDGSSYAPNLLVGSREGYMLTGADYKDYTTYSSSKNSEGFLEYTMEAILAGGWQQYRYAWVQSFLSEYYKEGETYTLSADIKSTAPGYIQIDSRVSGVSENRKKLTVNFPNTNGEWVRVGGSLKMEGLANNNLSLLQLSLSNAPVGATVTMRKVCLTRGTSAEYVPASSEMVGTSVTMISNEVRYSTVHNSATQPADATFTLPSVPTLTVGQYLWSRTRVAYNNGQSTVSYSVSRIGTDGATGSNYTDNLLPGTKDWKGWVYDSAFTPDGTYEGLDVIHASKPSGTTGYFDIRLSDKTNLENNTVYTLSVWAKGSGVFRTYVFPNVNAQIICIDGEASTSTISDTGAPHTLTSQWKRYYVVFRTVASGSLTGKNVIAARLFPGVEVWIAGAKLERGDNRNTVWSPASSEQLGVTIKSKSVTYAKNTTGAQPADSAFTATSVSALNLAPGDYMWSKTEVTYTDGAVTKSYAVSRVGVDGNNAKVVVVNSDATAFTYKDDFATLVGPQSINLTASLQATSGYQWSYKLPGQTAFTNISGATSSTYSLTHNATIWGSGTTNKAITLRCTSGGMHDEVTVVKVSSGAAGSNGAGYAPNLLNDTKKQDFYWGSDYPNNSTRVNSKGADGFGVMTQTLTATGNHNSYTWLQAHFSGKPYEVFVPGRTYTLSFEYKSDAQVYASFDMRTPNNANLIFIAPKKQFPASAEWKRVSITAVMPANTSNNQDRVLLGAGIDNGYGAVGDSASFRKFCLVEGESAEWVPSLAEMTGAAGADAYTVILTNESHIFEGDTEKAKASSTECGIVAYKGATKVAASIGSISGQPAGMTTAIASNGTSAAKFTVSVNTSLKQKQGTLTIPVTVDGKTFNKVFSWSLSLEGVPGANYTPNLVKDSKGPHTITASSTENYSYLTYKLETPIEVKAGDVFAVSAEKIETLAGNPTQFGFVFYEYNGVGAIGSAFLSAANPKGTITVGKAATITQLLVYAGKTGATSGNSVKYTKVMLVRGDKPAAWSPAASEMAAPTFTEEYYLSTSDTALSGGSWSETKQPWVAGRYYWTRTRMDYADGTVKYTQPICATGQHGTNGTSPYSLDLNNEVIGMASDATGAVTGQYPNVTAIMYRGSSRVTSATFSIPSKTGISTAFVTNAGIVTMSGMTADTATVTVQATVGGVTLQKTIRLYKVKPGFDGLSYSGNLLKESNVLLNAKAHYMSGYAWDDRPAVNTECTLTMCGKVGPKDGYIEVYQNKGYNKIGNFDSRTEAVRSFKFQVKDVAGRDTLIDFFHNPNDGDFDPDTYVKWAVISVGDSPQTVWTPSISEMKGAIVYSLQTSVDNVIRDALGVLSVSTVTATKYKTTADGRATTTDHYLYYRIISKTGTSENIAWVQGAGVGSATTPAIAIKADTKAIEFELRNSAGLVLDRESVPVFSDAGDLKVGGTNLLRNTDFIDGFKYWGHNFAAWLNAVKIADEEDDVNDFEGRKSVKVSHLENASTWRKLFQQLPKGRIEPGKTYTLSGFVYIPDKSVFGTDAYRVRASMCYKLLNDTGNHDNSVIDLMNAPEGKWWHASGLWTAPANIDTEQPIEMTFYLVQNGEYYVNGWKLEEGNVPTAWSVSPYDMSYLRSALKYGGTMSAGLVLSNLMQVGTGDPDSTDFKVTAGMNGSTDVRGERSIATWAGGGPVDAEAPGDETPAKTVQRHDGTAYYCDNTVRLEENRMEVGEAGSDKLVVLDDDGLKLVDGNEQRLRVVHQSVGNLTSAVKVHPVALNSSDAIKLRKIRGTNLGTGPGWTGTTRLVEGFTRDFDIGSSDLPVGATVNVTATVEFNQPLYVDGEGFPLIGVNARLQIYEYNSGIVVFDAARNVSYDGPQWEVHKAVIKANITLKKECKYRGKIILEGDGTAAGPAYEMVQVGATAKAEGNVRLGFANQSVMGNDGFLTLWGDVAALVNADGIHFKAGNYELLISKTGIYKIVNGGVPTPL